VSARGQRVLHYTLAVRCLTAADAAVSLFWGVQAAMKTFEGVKELDKANEQVPTKEKVEKSRQYRRRQTLEDIHATN